MGGWLLYDGEDGASKKRRSGLGLRWLLKVNISHSLHNNKAPDWGGVARRSYLTAVRIAVFKIKSPCKPSNKVGCKFLPPHHEGAY